MDRGINLLSKLCLAFGPMGCEDDVRNLIREEITDLCDEVRTDKMGNLIALRRGNGQTAKKVMLAAHMDEVGFMVTHIDEEGYIHFGTVGGVDPRVLCGRRVIFGDETKRVSGIIASKAIHHLTAEEVKEPTPVDRMYVDIGAVDRADAEQYLQPGDYGTFDSDFTLFGDHKLKSKAIDDRIGCAVMCELLASLNENRIETPYDLYCVFSVGEEGGISGATTAAYAIAPDRAIVLESTAVSDIAGVPDEAKVADIGEGGVISLMDRLTIYDRDFIHFALDTARKYGIKAQVKRYVSGGNDAGGIYISRDGVKTLAISAAGRYMHSASLVIDLRDYDAIKDLVFHILCEIEL